MSPFSADKSYNHWSEDLKWFGSFQVKWLYVCDVVESQYQHIKEKFPNYNNYRNDDNNNKGGLKNIGDFPDGTKISSQAGIQMMHIFAQNMAGAPKIFDQFHELDIRED